MDARRHCFDSLDADIVLQSNEQENPAQFRVHRCILTAASSVFHDMFSLPQDPAVTHNVPVISTSETKTILGTFLEFIYPREDPHIQSLDELVSLFGVAIKYDCAGVTATLRKLLVASRFVEAEPIRVYAIACRFELEEEARIASKYTLTIQVLDAPILEDLKYISAYSYHQLLDLHRRRASATIALVKVSPDIKCMQCNGSTFSMHAIPKWWYQFEKMAKEELSVRPTSDVIFGMEFLAQVAMVSECQRCAGSILDSWKFLRRLQKAIDDLPATI